jgi:hypothetical protein
LLVRKYMCESAGLEEHTNNIFLQMYESAAAILAIK